jgi:sulfhydrogenase subunit beta (sulfur reductase)
MHYLIIHKEEWDKALEQLLLSYNIFAPVKNEYSLDYELIRPDHVSEITYNEPKPATSLKNLFLPVKENVTAEHPPKKPRIIIGAPNCDIEGLGLLDEIYLDRDFTDQFYKNNRENTILIASDCFGIQEHCHCLSYGVKPYTVEKADLAVIYLDDKIIIRVISVRGEELVSKITDTKPLTNKGTLDAIEKEHNKTEDLLRSSNKGLPDYISTGRLVQNANTEIWEKYSSTCVSCGACTTICPTCTCFLLIDKPGFEKVKQLDACQYPGFERVAGGEDSLFDLHNRFRNRYMCKYVWKPAKFNSIACTGCGRCIEACIGKINKNELFMELT